MSDEFAHLPAWVRRRDGSQVPFEPDRICQSLYAAAEDLGTPSAFLIRELTDVVLHFLAQNPFDGIPSTADIVAEVEKIVREVGQPALAFRFAEMQSQTAPTESADAVAMPRSAERVVHDCLESYALRTVFSRDVAAAAREGLVQLGGMESPDTLTSLVLDTPRLAELPWWLALDDWRASGGKHWIVESPEWLCTPQMHPALTPHLCERLLSLPTLAERDVELHLNISEPPIWSPGHQVSPLFAGGDDDISAPERSNFLDGLLERWRSLQAPRMPAIAWHLSERSFTAETQRRQLQGVLRLAVLGRAIRFVFDRPYAPVTLAEGLDRKCPGVLLEVGLDLARFADQPEIARDGDVFLKKLPSLARIAVSAAAQKRQYLRKLPDRSPLKRRFLIERAAAAIVPLGLDVAVQSLTGASLMHNPLSLDYAARVMRTLKSTLQTAGRAINLDLRLDSPPSLESDAGSPREQLDIAAKLDAHAATAIVRVGDENIDVLVELLASAWQSSAVVRLRFERAGAVVQQGELPI